MQKLKTLSVTFSEPIAPQELECFRGAIIEKVGIDREWYHNHDNSADQSSNYHYRYPLIQYQLSHGRPRLLFINNAIDEARYFFTQNDWSLQLNGRSYESGIARLKASQAEFGLLEEMRTYEVYSWLGLNNHNHKAYLDIARLSDKIVLLERILAGHILSMAKGLNYRFPERFELFLTDFKRSRTVHYKGTTLQAMDFSFSTNVALPLGLALGKGVSLGFGRVVKPMESSVGKEITV